MVAAYAMFANGGERVEPTLVDRVQDRYGNTVYRHDQRDLHRLQLTRASRAGLRPADRVEPRAGHGCDHGLSADVDDEGCGGSRHGSVGHINLPVPMAGKTGTTNDARMCGSSALPATSWRAATSGLTNPRPMGRGAYGGTHVRTGLSALHERGDQEVRRRQFRGAPGGCISSRSTALPARGCRMMPVAPTWWRSTSARAKSRSLGSCLMAALPWATICRLVRAAGQSEQCAKSPPRPARRRRWATKASFRLAQLGRAVLTFGTQLTALARGRAAARAYQAGSWSTINGQA